MNSEIKVLGIFNKIFWIIIIIIFMNEGYHLLEPKIIGIYGDKNSVTDSDIINELTECATTYFDTINYKQYDKANMLNSYLNRKDYSEYEEIYNEISTESSYKIIVKYAYRLTNETYRCYIVVQDLSSEDYKFMNITDKNDMYEVVVKLNTKNSTFKILHDRFN